ncbi:hypothetical protein QFZ52_001372 [Arthrobacter woluwensis]|uniref:DUF998 domain-containing protein n=1 Tax=Arthrobacter woluwensis TaxID=156980 RepID=UPI00278265DA|nr:DUF998 domain-containing protein [Arthrobacter woluwensis]MDQ0708720.1 hypothetical protein [Arthrobacter woluwensis]
MTHFLAAAATILFALRLLLFLLLHVLPGGIHPVHDTVSDYAASSVRRTRLLAGLASCTAAAAWLSLGAAVLSGAGRADPALGGWLLALGVLLAVMPFVPTDRSGTAITARGRIHLLLAITWFTLAYSTIGPLSRLIAGPPGAVAALGLLNTIAAISLAALVIALLVRPLRRRFFGLCERLFILAVTVAPLVGAWALATQ